MADYFREYLKVAPLSHALWRANEARALEKFNFDSSVLDIGCGFGEFAGVFFDSQITMGIDISKKEIFKAIKAGKYEKALEADARNLPFPDNSFKTVISISVLEHIRGIKKVLSEVYRVLKKDGLFIFTVPTLNLRNSLLFPRVFEKIGLGSLADFYFYLYNQAFNHEAIYSPKKWKSLTQKAGFEITHFQGTLSLKTVVIYELFLPLALPTQFSKALLGKRLPFSPQWRVNLLYKVFKPLILQKENSQDNLLIVARKPR
ncbi:MAG TPA: class I SAM-dependent methyltransferase [Candidatus Bathyarchaeia archaeon]|nr:class I SAM-dependent methyltransferase [Candidatus Bathyarchaeia archaeon]